MAIAVDVAGHERAARESLPQAALLIGDERRTRGGDGSVAHVNPSTGKPQADIPMGGADDIDAAVAAARAASVEWRSWRPDQRRDALTRLAMLVRADDRNVGNMLTLECGIPTTLAGSLAHRAADYLHYYAGLADKLEGSVIPIFPEQAFDYTIPEPWGVIGIITTWNGGISSAARKAGAALAAGNTVVIKSMELAPFSVQRFGELAREAGLPAGAVNIVPGGVAAGRALSSHPGIHKISFVGGETTARHILAAAGQNLTPVVLELGGKSGSIVFPDADLEAAGRLAGTICMSMAGQGCIFPTRLIVHESVHDEIVDRAVATASGLRVGDPLDTATFIGPVVSEGQRNRILGMIERARTEPGEFRLGGNRFDGDGFFLQPTIIDRVAPDAFIAQNEVFGPVLSVITFRDEEEAIAIANGTRYSLAGYVHTSDVRRAHRVASRLTAGYIAINGFAALPASAPFGGFGASGSGKEGGREGLNEFLRTKNVYLSMA